jgi:hypothetical protein
MDTIVQGGNEILTNTVNDSLTVDVEVSGQLNTGVSAKPDCIVEIAVVAEAPSVAFKQAIFTHVPLGTYSRPGIIAYSRDDFAIIDGTLHLRNGSSGGSTGGSTTPSVDTSVKQLKILSSQWVRVESDSDYDTYQVTLGINDHGFVNPFLKEAVMIGSNNDNVQALLDSSTINSVLYVRTEILSDYMLFISGDIV